MGYFYSREKLEIVADNINKRFYPKRLEDVSPLDPYDLLEKLGLDVEWKFISPNMEILGMIFFNDDCWPVWDKGTYKHGDMPNFEKFKRGTIVINEALTSKKYANKERFVCGHEVSHWIKDQDYFKNHPTDVIHVCGEDACSKTYWNSKMSELDVVERQTNYLNAAILMPRNTIIKAFEKISRYKYYPDHPLELKTYMKAYVKELAYGFGLNYNPVLYRLYDLGVLKRPE